MESIASFKYPAARPLFVYIKGAHLKAVPGLKEFVAEYTRESTWGPQGYLVRRGLVPMDTAERQRYAKIAGSLAPLDLASVKRSEEHTYELQSLMRTSYAVFCFKKK